MASCYVCGFWHRTQKRCMRPHSRPLGPVDAQVGCDAWVRATWCVPSAEAKRLDDMELRADDEIRRAEAAAGRF